MRADIRPNKTCLSSFGNFTHFVKLQGSYFFFFFIIAETTLLRTIIYIFTDWLFKDQVLWQDQNGAAIYNQPFILDLDVVSRHIEDLQEPMFI